MRYALLVVGILVVAPIYGEYEPIDFSSMTIEEARTYGIGYIPKACNFDLDDDLIFGEPEDCTVCDDTEGMGQIIEDFDNDGALEVQTYVDGGMGFDSPDCGGPSNPCKTVMWAKDALFRIDHAENAICFRGILNEWIHDDGTHDGQDGYKVWREGRMEDDWLLPTNPTMLVGWDYDNDNIYPPVDQDDIADFVGESDNEFINVFFTQDCDWDGSQCIQKGNLEATSRWELAHFRVKRYGTQPDQSDRGLQRGLFHASRTMPDAEISNMVFFHDIAAKEINYDGDSTSAANMLYELWDRKMNNHTIWNVDVRDSCGYYMRGSGIGGLKDGLMVRNTTITNHCGDDAEDGNVGTPGIKMWGTYQRVRIWENYWDQSPVSWAIPDVTRISGGIMAINTCVRDFKAKYNIFKNAQDYFVIQGGLRRGCQERNGDNIEFSSNLGINDDDWNSFIPFVLLMGGDELVFTKNAKMTNNVFLDFGETPNMKRAIHIQDEIPGDSDLDPTNDLVEISNNTFYTPRPDGYAGWFTVGAGDRRKQPDGTYILIPDKSHIWNVSNNIFALDTAQAAFPNYSSSEHPALVHPLDINLTMENNVWELVPQEGQPASRLMWISQNGDKDIKTNSLAEFSAHTGWSATDRGYEQNWCKVEFEDRATGNVNVSAADTCANGAGADLSWLEYNVPPPDPCGNGVCDPGETYETCPYDCPAPPVSDQMLNVCVVPFEGGEICFEGVSVTVTPKEE